MNQSHSVTKYQIAAYVVLKLFSDLSSPFMEMKLSLAIVLLPFENFSLNFLKPIMSRRRTFFLLKLIVLFNKFYWLLFRTCSRDSISLGKRFGHRFILQFRIGTRWTYTGNPFCILTVFELELWTICENFQK